VLATRPHGFIVKPFKPANVTTVVSVVLNNYAHRKLDVMRTSNDIVDDIPFVLKRVIEHIELNLEKKILTGDLAKITKWKPQHFQRLFIRFLGVTPNQYILNRRIEKAKALLAETPLTITNISNDLGFKNPSTFYLKFKKSTNKTPDAYRKWAKAMKEYV
jgi:AraC-like DNA-binding protein